MCLKRGFVVSLALNFLFSCLPSQRYVFVDDLNCHTDLHNVTLLERVF